MKRMAIVMVVVLTWIITACGYNGKNWYKENGFTITEQGKHVLHTTQNNNVVDTGLVDVPFDVKVYESKDGVESGMKKVIYELVLDTSQKTDFEIEWLDFLIDRKSGAIFHNLTDERGNVDESLPIPVESNGKTIDVYYVVEPRYDYENCEYTFKGTLTCPESYNDAVFYVGYYDRKSGNEMYEKYEEEPFSYILSDFAGFNEHRDSQFFFSANNK
jgi:hypothetical protein